MSRAEMVCRVMGLAPWLSRELAETSVDLALAQRDRLGSLPPDVTICEARHPGANQWAKVKILADKEPGSPQRACRDENDRLWWASEFRPIQPTAEQIAAEDREKELNRMVATVSMLDKGWARKVCAGLYDAGYRKFEIVDGEA